MNLQIEFVCYLCQTTARKYGPVIISGHVHVGGVIQYLCLIIHEADQVVVVCLCVFDLLGYWW